MLSYKNCVSRILRFLNNPGRIKPSRIYKNLEPLRREVILAIMAKSPSRAVKKRIAVFLTRYNGTKLRIGGEDLERLGLKAGPEFGKILTAALYAKLDNAFTCKRQELDFVQKFIKNGKLKE